MSEQTTKPKAAAAVTLTSAHIDDQIVGEQYHVFPGTTMTVCCLTLRNGFNVIGYSACVHPDNFDAAVGRALARSNARDKVWELEGYLLRDQLWYFGEDRGGRIEPEDRNATDQGAP